MMTLTGRWVLPLVLLFSVSASVVLAEELRNPFRKPTRVDPVTPAVAVAVPEERPTERQLPPLQRDELKSYRLMGVMLSQQRSIATIRNRLGEQYLIRVGEPLGIEGAIVEEMAPGRLQLQLEQQPWMIAIGSVGIPLRLVETAKGQP